MIWRAATVGDGAQETLGPPGVGRVVGIFGHGFYVRSGSCLAAVGGPAMPPGPIHVTLPDDPRAAAEGELVALGSGCLVGSGWGVDLRTARRFIPLQPRPEQMGAAAESLLITAGDDRPPEDVRTVWDGVVDAVTNGDLDTSRRLLQGRGAGLTPTGDDVLAGLLLFHSWCVPHSNGRAVAEATETTELSRCFLRWAAVGQSILPVHELLDGAVRGDLEAAATAASRVALVGSSSGQALLAGLRLAATVRLAQPVI